MSFFVSFRTSPQVFSRDLTWFFDFSVVIWGVWYYWKRLSRPKINWSTFGRTKRHCHSPIAHTHSIPHIPPHTPKPPNPHSHIPTFALTPIPVYPLTLIYPGLSSMRSFTYERGSAREPTLHQYIKNHLSYTAHTRTSSGAGIDMAHTWRVRWRCKEAPQMLKLRTYALGSTNGIIRIIALKNGCRRLVTQLFN